MKILTEALALDDGKNLGLLRGRDFFLERKAKVKAYIYKEKVVSQPPSQQYQGILTFRKTMRITAF